MSLPQKIDLSKCVPGQELKLRDGEVVKYIRRELVDFHRLSQYDLYYNDGRLSTFNLTDKDVVRIVPIEQTPSKKIATPQRTWEDWELAVLFHFMSCTTRSNCSSALLVSDWLKRTPAACTTKYSTTHSKIRNTYNGNLLKAYINTELKTIEEIGVKEYINFWRGEKMEFIEKTIDLTKCIKGQKLQRRDGVVVHFEKTIESDSEYNVYIKVDDIKTVRYVKDGKYFAGEPKKHPKDIVKILPIETNVEVMSKQDPNQIQEVGFSATIVDKYKYAVKDEDGKWFVYENKPILDRDRWVVSVGNYVDVTKLISFPNVPWKQSLHIRIDKTFLPYFEKDEKVEVRFVGESEFKPAHFSNYTIHEDTVLIWVYSSGRTSHTSLGVIFVEEIRRSIK